MRPANDPHDRRRARTRPNAGASPWLDLSTGSSGAERQGSRVLRQAPPASSDPLTKIVRTLNEQNVPGSIRAAKGWSPATISRILDNEKYAGRWIWNRIESRRDPRTGRRRRFEKPENEWVIHEDEGLRIVPQPLWDTVRERRKEMHRTWPGGNGKRVLQGRGQPAGALPYPSAGRQHGLRLLGRPIVQVSKSGGYYGCLAATKGACENKTLVRRTLAERVILEAVQEQISNPAHIAYVLRRVEEEIAKLRLDLPDTLKLTEAELTAEQRRLANFVDFIGEGRGSQALAKAVVETERRVDVLTEEVDGLQRSREKVFRAPPIEWIKDRLSNLQEILEHRTAHSAPALRNIFGPIRLELVTPDIGRPSYRALTTLDALALIHEPPSTGAEGGSNKVETAGIEPASAVA